MTSRAENTDVTKSKDPYDLIEIEGDIDPLFDIPNNGNILIISKDQTYLTHGIHKFPAKFFPELPRYLIRRYSEIGDSILDPMCGSGTVILEALLNGRKGIGLDIDPMAKLISKVKTTPLRRKILLSSKDLLLQRISEYATDTDSVLEIPKFPYRDNWFRECVLKELAIISASINEIIIHYSEQTQKDLFDFYRVIMSSIIREMSNADPHCTRTVLRKKITKDIKAGDTLARFTQRLESQVTEMLTFSKLYQTLETKDVSFPSGTAIETGLDSSSIHLAMTSPPYINAVDYPRTHQLEMYWLGFLADGPLSQVKRKYIGTETVYRDEYNDLHTSDVVSLNSILKQIYIQDPRRSYIVCKFFDDMTMQLREIFRVLKSGGRYCIAIGDNVIRGVRVPSHQIISEIAVTQIGFTLEKQFFSKLIRHFIRIPRRERMHGEWVLVLEKP